MARQPDARKQQHWLDLMSRWRQAQLTVRAFCARHRLSEANFYRWRRVLRQRGLLCTQPTPARRAPPAPPRPSFVKLTIAAEAPAPTAVELVLSAGRLLRVQPGFDPATLLQLVHLLEEPAC